MGRILKGWLVTIIVLAFCGLIWLVLLAAASNPRVTSEQTAENLKHAYLLESLREEYFKEIPSFYYPTVKPQLGAEDAVENLVFVFVVWLTSLVIAIVGGIGLIIMGIVTADWGQLIMGVLLIPAGIIAPFLTWIMLIFQSGTPAYYLIMILGGIVASLGGLISGTASVGAPAMVIRIFVE